MPQSPAHREAPKKPNTSRFWLTVSRPEFLPANSASLIIGLAWGLTLPVDFLWGLVAPLVLTFAAISLVGAFAAHINTMADYELDQKDDTKKELVAAMASVGKSKLKKLMVAELSLSLFILLVLTVFEGKLVFVFMWVAAVFFAYAYSAQPLRLKSRSFFAPITLIIVLSILPVTFVTYVFTSTLDWAFFLFLAGQALTVYGVIVPAEIRDYFSDKATGTETMTVRLGLVKASLLGLTLLSAGGILCATGFILKLTVSSLPILSVLLIVMAVAYLYVLSKYWKILSLSKHLDISPNQASVEQEIVQLAAKNPKWITIVTQAIVFMCVILLIAKFL
jgi:1,4-dihydroxy-2-naphthoate octaprenyltransferase